MVVQDRVQRHVVRFGLEIRQKARREAQTDGERPRLQRGQHAVIKATAVAKPIAARRITHTRHKQQRGHDHLGVLGLGDAIGIFFHRTAWIPGMKGHGLVNFVHHRQSNTAGLGLIEQFAVFLPAVQGRERVKFALDRPVGANHRIRTAQQPNAHHALQKIGALSSIRQVQTLLNEKLAKGFFFKRPFFIRVIHNPHMQFHTILTSIALLGCLALSAIAPAYAQAKAPGKTQADEAILDMSQAFKKVDSKRLSALLPQVRGHVLEPWGAYWELRARLDTATPGEIQAFLTRFAGTYQEDRLRNDWLLLLGKNREWGTFLAEYPNFRMNDDRSVRCYALLTEFNARELDVARQVEDLWLAQRDADDGCAAAAEQQIKAGKLKPHSAWLRARLGMENDRPRMVSQSVGLLNADWASTASAIYANPRHYLDGKLLALRPRTKELVTLAMIRLAVSEPDAAAIEIDKLRWKTQLTQEERSWVWGAIGKRAAMRLSDGAIAYFLKGQDQFMQDDQLAWKVRAALRAGNWAQVSTAIAAMSEGQRKDPSWVYWRARALLSQAKGEADRAEATRLLTSIAGVGGFYEQLALEELGQRITVPERPTALTPEEKDTVRRNAGLNRALYAIDIGLRSEGVREWNYSTNLHQRGGMSDRELLAAAELACQHEVWDRCINTSERTKSVIDFEQRFPMPHKDAVLQRATQIGLDPAYVYGLIRQESRFIMDARSGVGASGLMQVMPPTARWTAKKIGLTSFQPHQITDRDTNIAIGTGYLKLVLDDFAGSMPMAAAAYNAGPGRPRSWRGQSGAPVLEAAIWAENVPFTETRDYVKKVLSNTTNYAALITGQPQSLKSRLGLVGPRDAGATAMSSDLP